MTNRINKRMTQCVDLEIPEGVQEIKPYAYADGLDLRFVELPSTVTKIGEYAFHGCDYLLGFTVSPNNMYFTVDSAGALITRDQSTLLRVPPCTPDRYDVPQGVNRIAPGAFNGCKYLTEITLPDSVVEIGNLAFENCRQLQKLHLPRQVETVGDHAFKNCTRLERIRVSKQNLHFSDGGTGILLDRKETRLIRVPEAFPDVVQIPLTVTAVDRDALECCTALEGIISPESALPDLKLAAYHCKPLPRTVLADAQGVWYDWAKMIVQFPSLSSISQYVVPEGVVKINEVADSRCTSGRQYPHTVVTLPASVTVIHPRAFEGCHSLTLCAPAGSYAEAFARQKKIPFIPL